MLYLWSVRFQFYALNEYAFFLSLTAHASLIVYSILFKGSSREGSDDIPFALFSGMCQRNVLILLL